MSYRLLILRRAQKELAELPAFSFEKAKTVIYRLAEDPRPRGSRKLTGRDGWRVRVGDYRIIYEVDNVSNSITILHVGHRKDVYK